MNTRQAIIVLTLLCLLAGLWACSPAHQQLPTLTPDPPSVTPAPTKILLIPTSTPLACLSQPGQLKQDSILTTKPPQDFLIYLPPCYAELKNTRYPVLYLLHGLTYTDDQWPRIGAVTAADQMILSGQAPPFIIVFPDDQYWNTPAGTTFGDRLINILIPYVDANYHTLADRGHRALGGLSLGGGLTVRLGFTHPELFGELGLHSPAVSVDDAGSVEYWIRHIPPTSRPRLWFDIGDQDRELTYGRILEDTLTRNNYPHEFHLYSGDHSENYWRLHVQEYLQWYVEGWSNSTSN